MLTHSFLPTVSSLWAAVMTFLVPLEMSLLKLLGMMAQVPTKLLSPSSTRHVQGNSPGLDSPLALPLACLTGF